MQKDKYSAYILVRIKGKTSCALPEGGLGNPEDLKWLSVSGIVCLK
jgi:hypothetical protein